MDEMKSGLAGDENSTLAPEQKLESSESNQDNTSHHSLRKNTRFGKWIFIVILLLILISTSVAAALFFQSNYTSSCSVSWVDFPKQISPNTNYTVYIKKINTTHKWRDVSVFKDIDIYPDAQREGGLTGDDWQNPTNTYTFTFNSGDMGEHKLYFYNNDFESYGESSGTGPKTLCEPVFRYVTEEKIISSPTSTLELTPLPTLTASETATWKTYSDPKRGVSFSYPSDWSMENLIYGYSLIPSDKKQNNDYENYPPITIGFEENPKNLTLEEWEEVQNAPDSGNQFHDYVSPETQKTTINGNPAYINKIGETCEPSICYEVFILGNGKIWLLKNIDFSGEIPVGKYPNGQFKELYTKNDILVNQQIFDALLSTFKFIDLPSNTDAEDWET